MVLIAAIGFIPLASEKDWDWEEDPGSLYLANNEITGTLPASIGKMKRLKILDVFGNRMSGVLPPELGDLQNAQQAFQISLDIMPKIGSSHTGDWTGVSVHAGFALERVRGQLAQGGN